LLVVDECFMEFLPDWKNHTLKPLAGRSENLIVIDAFTKTYSLAGFRLGFCVSGNTALLAAMRLHGQAFSVSVPAQMAGLCALSDGEYMRRTYRLLSEEREWLLSQLQKLPVEVFASQANFLLLKTADREIRQKLLEKGVKVRDCSCFHGLSSAYCRVAIRTRRENTALVENLTAVLC
jgi:threonine-phosphate decarboxylase